MTARTAKVWAHILRDAGLPAKNTKDAASITKTLASKYKTQATASSGSMILAEFNKLTRY